MLDLSRARLATKYIVFELIPVFLLGVSAFIFLLVMFQSFKLSEYIIVHGAKFNIMAKLVFYMTLGYLPLLFPIAILFAVLLTYSRLSGDSEIVAMKALGLKPLHLLFPALIVGTFVSLSSLQTSFRLAPWGNKNLNELINQLAQTRPSVSIREGVFSEGFFDLVVYTNKIDPKTGNLKKIFIYDARDAASPLTIIAREGQLINTNSMEGRQAFLRLIDGNVHKSSSEFYTKIDFGSYDISLYDPHEVKEVKASPEAMNLSELKEAIKNSDIKTKEHMNFLLEWHRRWSLSTTCLIFALLGMSLGTETNRRSARSGSLVISVSAIVIYWAIQISFESLARSGKIPAGLGVWMANLTFLLFGLYRFRRVSEN